MFIKIFLLCKMKGFQGTVRPTVPISNSYTVSLGWVIATTNVNMQYILLLFQNNQDISVKGHHVLFLFPLTSL